MLFFVQKDESYIFFIVVRVKVILGLLGKVRYTYVNLVIAVDTNLSANDMPRKAQKTVKQIYVISVYDSVLQKNQERILSSEGIQLRTNQSIQVEGAFGVLKQDFQFGRLLHRGNDHVRKMLYLLAMGFNILKLHHRI